MRSGRRAFIGIVAALMAAAAAGAQAPGTAATLASSKDATRSVTAPSPSGPYAVGRRFAVWTDSARRDPVDTTRAREVAVWIWYPADPTSRGALEPVLPAEWRARRIATLTAKLGPDVARAAGSLAVHARADAPIAEGGRPFPVLLFGPGLGWLASDYSVLLEDLASHGYVVVGIASPGFADVVRSSDGRESVRTLGIGEKIATDQSFVHDDMAFVLRRLRERVADPGDFLHGRGDLARVGAFGHSLGGTTALVLAARDSGIRAAVNIDGDPMGDVVGVRPRQPLLLISSQVPTVDEAPPGRPARWMELTREGLERSERRRTNDWLGMASEARESYRVRIIGTHHLDFEDAAPASSWLDAPELRWMRFGTIDGARALAVTAAVVREFFDHALGGTRDAPPFRALAERIPEIRLLAP
jgi:dienelactone hydrolase